ncbi:unnamed protein product [Symbiodinium microadriaticum]|nr:unnamed protein product [Symbiodinium microadriaticum]
MAYDLFKLSFLQARQGVDSLPRWAQRELRDSHRTAEPDTSLQIGEVPVLEDRGSKDLPQLVPIVHEAAALAAQVRRLGEVEFQEDALELVDAEGPWAASALVQGAELLGFVVFGVLNGSWAAVSGSLGEPGRTRTQGCRFGG